MVNYLRTLLTARLAQLEERGASAVEYGLLLAGIAIVVLVGVVALGPKVRDMFQNTSSSIDSATQGNGS